MDPARTRFWWAVIGAFVVVISFFHYMTPISAGRYHLIYMQGYFIPILIAAFQFGIRGGLGIALTVSLIYLPHITLQWSGNFEHNLLQFLQIGMYNIIGYLTGLKAQQEREEKNRYQTVAQELEHSLTRLKEQSEKLSELEDQLRQLDRLAIVGELTASLAHEVRNPLGSILGAVEILQDELPPESQKMEFFTILLEETARLNKVVENYLNFARKQNRQVVSYDVREPVRNSVAILAARARKSQVRFTIDIPEKPIILKGDPNQLRQVLMNLLLNAIQAMPAGGTIIISGKITTNGGEPQTPMGNSDAKGDFQLHVRDEGRGIPADKLKQIFTPFYTTKPDGTGLGLSIVRRIVDENHWRIKVHSRQEEGTEFIVRIPLS